jgi:hypothetical protein
MRKPGDEARMAKMRARRAPFTDARDGRVKSRVRQAFRLYGRPLTTTELVKHCYCWVLQGEKIKSWHRSNIARVADVLATRIGRATSQGRPIMWSPRPELMQDQRRVGLKHRRSVQRANVKEGVRSSAKLASFA